MERGRHDVEGRADEGPKRRGWPSSTRATSPPRPGSRYLLTGEPPSAAQDLAQEAFVRCTVGSPTCGPRPRSTPTSAVRSSNLHTPHCGVAGSNVSGSVARAHGARTTETMPDVAGRQTCGARSARFPAPTGGPRAPLLRGPVRAEAAKAARVQRRRRSSRSSHAGRPALRVELRDTPKVRTDERPRTRSPRDCSARSPRRWIPSILLPAEVRRRSRLRQTSTVVRRCRRGCVAIGVALALVVGTFRGPAERVPVGPTSYPPRTATIHGITVTAPAGWTLLDDWPLASILVTSSQTCSFSATGSPVVGSSTNNAGSAGPSSEPSQSCDSHPVSLPAGVPVLQLANFSIELDETVCRTETELPVVPDDGVAVYVAAFPNGVSAQKFWTPVRTPSTGARREHVRHRA